MKLSMLSIAPFHKDIVSFYFSLSLSSHIYKYHAKLMHCCACLSSVSHNFTWSSTRVWSFSRFFFCFLWLFQFWEGVINKFQCLNKWISWILLKMEWVDCLLVFVSNQQMKSLCLIIWNVKSSHAPCLLPSFLRSMFASMILGICQVSN